MSDHPDLLIRGDVGAVNFPGLMRYVVQPATTRLLAFVHVALHGVQKRPPTELRDICLSSATKTRSLAPSRRSWA